MVDIQNELLVHVIKVKWQMVLSMISRKPADLLTHEVTSVFFIKISQAFTLSHSRCNRTCHEFQAQDYAETIIDLIIDVWGLERDVRELAI